MTLFWILSTAMLIAVLALLLRPLLAPASELHDTTAASNLRVLRAQLAELDADLAAGTLTAEQHAAARAEVERRVLEEAQAAPVVKGQQGGKLTAALVALAVPAMAVPLYFHLGAREAMDPAFVQRANQGEDHAGMDMETAVARLAERMKADPADPTGWALLGRSYAQMGRYAESRDAYKEAIARVPQDDANLLADYADAMGMAQGRTLIGAPEAVIQRALKADPKHLKALALAGSVAMEKGDYAQAVAFWTRARDVAPAGSPFAEGLSAGIAEARQKGGLPAEAAPTAASPTAAAPTPAAPAAAAPAGKPLRVTVTLAPALAAQAKPGELVYIFARAAEGPRMPLAIARVPLTTEPITVQLDDSMAMTPAMKLSAFAQVVVVARISKSGAGGANPQAGDLEGETVPVPSSGEVRVSIDRVRQ